jgi:hemerythrin
MEKMDWQASFNTGIRVIDEDHKMLFSIVNNLIDEVNSSADGEPREIESLLEALINYVDTHFAREEQFLEQFGYPELDTHRDTHDALRQQIDGIANDYKTQPDSVDLRKVCVFLINWLSQHILISDMDYVPYVTGDKTGTEPGLRARSQQVSVSVPRGTGNLVHELAYHLRHTKDVDAAVRHFNENHFSGFHKKRSFQKT